MNRESLHQLVKLGEGLTIEFKRSVSSELGREICAFANSLGGKLVIGVDDQNRIVGLHDINRVKSEVQSIARNLDPALPVDIEAVGDILVVTVPPGPSKPYMVGGKFFMREAATTQQMTRDEIREFFFKEGLIRFDDQVSRQFSMNKDFASRNYSAFVRAAHIPRGLNRDDVLRNLRVLTDDGIRNAGLLLFAKDPARFLPQAAVICAVFQGTGKTKIIDKRKIGGTVLEGYTGARAYLREHLNTEYVIRGGPRQEILELPEEALREAILNALAHRDYRLTDAYRFTSSRTV